jgi:hypothetical protein
MATASPSASKAVAASAPVDGGSKTGADMAITVGRARGTRLGNLGDG